MKSHEIPAESPFSSGSSVVSESFSYSFPMVSPCFPTVFLWFRGPPWEAKRTITHQGEARKAIARALQDLGMRGLWSYESGGPRAFHGLPIAWSISGWFIHKLVGGLVAINFDNYESSTHHYP